MVASAEGGFVSHGGECVGEEEGEEERRREEFLTRTPEPELLLSTLQTMYEKEKSEIQRLKQYLLTSLPSNLNLSSDSVAITAAIAGLDKETARLSREEKLIQRFQSVRKTEDVDMENSFVKMSKDDATSQEDDEKDDEWMETTVSDGDDEAQKWASAAINRISSGGVKVKSPLGALGLVLHGALLELSSNDRGDGKFICTGVPPQDVLAELLVSSGGGLSKPKVQDDGFAPPVRELPNGQLVPANWEEGYKSPVGRVAFRYKCGRTDLSTMYLVIECKAGETSVYFGPLAKEVKRMTFQLDTYVNLDGMKAALEKGSPASPVLFYKSLKELLLSFASEFGLEKNAMRRTFGEGVSSAIEDISAADVVQHSDKSLVSFGPDFAGSNPNLGIKPFTNPLRVERRNRGDFEGDLLPGGPLPGPDFAEGPRIGGGNQVGPNHPLFDRTFGDDVVNHGDELAFDQSGPSFRVPGIGGFEMRPRFDPFGPPGGPTEPERRLRSGRGRGGRGVRGPGGAPPGGFGFPNPDHMQPPGM